MGGPLERRDRHGKRILGQASRGAVPVIAPRPPGRLLTGRLSRDGDRGGLLLTAIRNERCLPSPNSWTAIGAVGHPIGPPNRTPPDCPPCEPTGPDVGRLDGCRHWKRWVCRRQSSGRRVL